MIINGSFIDVSHEMLSDALPLAKSLFPVDWLENQQQLNFVDFVLDPDVDILSMKGIARALREGVPSKNGMHPMAEAIFGTEEILKKRTENKFFIADKFIYRLISLRDVAIAKDKIKNIDERLPRLMSEQWLPSLYEFLVAASQAQIGNVRLLEESEQASPDMAINDNVYLECKAKIEYEEKVRIFRRTFNSIALDKIFQEISKYNIGALVEIEVLSTNGINEIPKTIDKMIKDGIRRKNKSTFRIKITPCDGEEIQLPKPMRTDSEELWKYLMNFDSWNEWHNTVHHMLSPLEEESKMLVRRLKRPILICYRLKELMDSTQNIKSTIKDACRRQLKNHNPGIVRVLINSELYGFGVKSNPENIKKELDRLSLELLENHTRLSGVRFDIVTPPARGRIKGGYTIAGGARASDDIDFDAITSAPGIFLS